MRALATATVGMALGMLAGCGGFETCDPGGIRCSGPTIQVCYAANWMDLQTCTASERCASSRSDCSGHPVCCVSTNASPSP
jgi:hypothetical protein